MANRPCKPDGDLKKLWQTLMPALPCPPAAPPGMTPRATAKTKRRRIKIKRHRR